jgi:WD40 repeat protein
MRTPFPLSSQLYSVRLLLSIENLGNDDNPANRSDLLSNLQYDPAIGAVQGHSDIVTSIAFSPDGTLLASAGADLSILLWDTTTWEQVGDPILGHQPGTDCEISFEWHCPGEISSLAFSPDGSILASAGRDMTVRLWDPSTGESINEPLMGHEDGISDIAFSPDGTLLASASEDQTVRLWDPATGEQLGDPLSGHNRTVSSVAFSPDGSMLASGDWNNTIILWDPDTGTQLRSIEILQSADPDLDWDWTDEVWDVAFSPDGQMLASVTCGGRIDMACFVSLIELWDPFTGEKIDQIITSSFLEIPKIAFSPDGQLIVSVNDSGQVQIWDPITGDQLGDTMQIKSSERSFYNPTDLAFSPDGRLLAVAGCGLEGEEWFSCARGGIQLWDPISEAALSQTFSQKLEIPNSQRFEVSEMFTSLIFDEDGEINVALRRHISSTQISITFLDPDSVDQIYETSINHDYWLGSGEFNQSGSLLVGWERDTIWLWGVTNGEQIGRPLSWHTDNIKDVVFSPDGSVLASASYDDTIRLWDSSTGLQIGEPLTGHTAGVLSMLFSPDGRMLAVAGCGLEGEELFSCARGEIRLWNPLTGEQIGEPLVGSLARNASLAFSSDGKILAAASDEIWVWDITTGQQIGEPLPVAYGLVTSLAFNPEGNLLASASCIGYCETSEIRLWDLESGLQIGNSFMEGIVSISELVFSPDGNQLISLGCGLGGDQYPCSMDEIRWWDVNIESWIEKACQAAGRNLTLSEWEENFPGESYHITLSHC